MIRALTWLWLLFLVTLPLWMTNQYFLHVLISAGIFTIASMSLNLLLGYTGQLSLGHVAFFGIGAYTSALISLGFDLELTESYTFVFAPWPVWLAFLIGIVMAGIFGWLIGKISFKVRGAYFVIVTISFAQVVRLIALNWIDLTEGPMALNNIPPFRIAFPGLEALVFYKKLPNYYLVLAVAIVCYVIIRRLVDSRAGRAFIALRENETLAECVGVDVTRFLVLAAVVSAAVAGAAGGFIPIISGLSIRTCSCSYIRSPWGSWWSPGARAPSQGPLSAGSYSESYPRYSVSSRDPRCSGLSMVRP